MHHHHSMLLSHLTLAFTVGFRFPSAIAIHTRTLIYHRIIILSDLY